MRHDKVDDALLSELLSGEVGEDDPRVAALLARDPEARDRLRLLRELAQRLDIEGTELRGLLAQSRRLASAPGLDRFESVAADYLARPGRRRTWPWIVGVAVAASIPLILSIARPDDPDPTPSVTPPIRLGEGDVGLHPAEGAQFDGEFRWDEEPPPGGDFEIRVYDAADSDRTVPILTSGPVSESWWRLDPAQKDALPDTIEWTLIAYDALGDLVLAKQSGPVRVR